jgi:hypothetical protein
MASCPNTWSESSGQRPLKKDANRFDMTDMLGGRNAKLQRAAERSLPPVCWRYLVRVRSSVKKTRYFFGVARPASLVEQLPFMEIRISFGVRQYKSSLTVLRVPFPRRPSGVWSATRRMAYSGPLAQGTAEATDIRR